MMLYEDEKEEERESGATEFSLGPERADSRAWQAGTNTITGRRRDREANDDLDWIP